jgi:hypothetical protein
MTEKNWEEKHDKLLIKYKNLQIKYLKLRDDFRILNDLLEKGEKVEEATPK